MPSQTPTHTPAGREPTATDRSRLALAATLAGAGLVVVLVGGLAATSGTADAKFPIDNISNVDDTARLTPSGQNVAVSGWVACTAGEIAELRVTVTQGSTVATGQTHTRCLGEDTRAAWTIHAVTRGPDAFEADDTATVDAWAVTRDRGTITDGPHTWTNPDVELHER